MSILIAYVFEKITSGFGDTGSRRSFQRGIGIVGLLDISSGSGYGFVARDVPVDVTEALKFPLQISLPYFVWIVAVVLCICVYLQIFGHV